MRLSKNKFSDINLLNHGLLQLSINLSLLVVVLKGSGFELALLLILTCFVLLLITTTLLSLRLNASSSSFNVHFSMLSTGWTHETLPQGLSLVYGFEADVLWPDAFLLLITSLNSLL